MKKANSFALGHSLPRCLPKEHLSHILHCWLPCQTKNEPKGNHNHTRQRNKGKAYWSRDHDLAQVEEMPSLIKDKEIIIDPYPWGLCLWHKMWQLIFQGKGAVCFLVNCFLWFEGYGRSFDNHVCADFFSDYLVEFQISYGECQIGTANQDLQCFTRVPKEHTFWQETKYPSLLWIPWKASYLGPPGRLLFSRSLKIKYLALALIYWKTASGRITDIIHVFQ